jgi:hypothetical protein
MRGTTINKNENKPFGKLTQAQHFPCFIALSVDYGNTI